MDNYSAESNDLSENVRLRLDNLVSELLSSLKTDAVQITVNYANVLIQYQNLLICGITVEEEGYCIFNVPCSWFVSGQTSYLYENDTDATLYCYLESLAEAIGESERIVKFAIAEKSSAQAALQNSNLCKTVTEQAFETAFAAFLKQADENVITKKGNGSPIPSGFSKVPKCDGGSFMAHYGYGNASKSPYISWGEVSVYYVPTTGNIIVGIEENRYRHIKAINIKPVKAEPIGNKKESVIIYYSASKKDLNYSELYNNFIAVCSEVIRLGH